MSDKIGKKKFTDERNCTRKRPQELRLRENEGSGAREKVSIGKLDDAETGYQNDRVAIFKNVGSCAKCPRFIQKGNKSLSKN